MFGEALVFGRMLDAATDDDVRLGLLAERIDGAIATVFRQMAMNRFEHLVHTAGAPRASCRSSGSASSGSRLRPSCSATRWRSLDGYRMWWSYVPHFINTPGYVYAYAYGQLLALSVYSRYRAEGAVVRPALPGAARGGRLAVARRSSARSSGSTSPIPVSGRPGST